uniref:Uncharacterized protein n=1 Tax=Amphilophus citrinellus TaxID=61819 RepID=A0A3Q0SJM2_AMPCI
MSQFSPKISTHSLTLSPAASHSGPDPAPPQVAEQASVPVLRSVSNSYTQPFISYQVSENESSSLPKVPSFLYVSKNPNPTPVASVQIPPCPSPVLTAYRPPVIEARKSLTSLLESQMSLANSKPKSRSTYYGLTPTEYAAYGGIRTITSHQSPVPTKNNETSADKQHSDVCIDGSHISKPEKQLNGHEVLPSSVHGLQPVLFPKDSELPAEQVFEKNPSEAHSTGTQSLKTSNVDTVKPELPLGWAQKTIQQSPSDVSTPKASYSEAPVPIPKAGEVHTQSVAQFSVEAALKCLTDNNDLSGSSSAFAKADLNAGTHPEAKVINLMENGYKPNKTPPLSKTNKRDQSGKTEIAPTQTYHTAHGVSLPADNDFNVQINAKPVKNLADCENPLVQPPATQIKPKFSESAIINGEFHLEMQESTKLVSEPPLITKVTAEATLHKQIEEVRPQTKLCNEVRLPTKTNAGNTLPLMAECFPDKAITELSFLNIYPKEPFITTTRAVVPHEPVTASVCSAQYNIYKEPLDEQSPKFIQPPKAETQVYRHQPEENKNHLPTLGAPNMSVNAATEPKLSAQHATATQSPKISNKSFPLKTDSFSAPTKQPQKLPNINEITNTQTTGSNGQGKDVQVTSFYTNSSRVIGDTKLATEITLNTKDAVIPNQTNTEPKLPNSAVDKVHPYIISERTGLLTGNMPIEHLPTTPSKTENIQEKRVFDTKQSDSSLLKGTTAVNMPLNENKISSKPNANQSSSFTDAVSPRLLGNLETIQQEKAQTKHFQNSNTRYIPAAESKVPDRLNVETVLPVMADAVKSGKRTFNAIQALPPSPTMRCLTPKSPQMKSERFESLTAVKPAINTTSISGSVDGEQFGKACSLFENKLSDTPEHQLAIKTHVNSVISKETTTSLCTGYTAPSTSVEEQTTQLARSSQIIGNNIQAVNLVSSQTVIKHFSSVPETNTSIETNICTVNSPTISYGTSNKHPSTNIQPFNEATIDLKAPHSHNTATNRSPLPERRLCGTPKQSCTPTLPQSPQIPVNLNHVTEINPSRITMKDQINPPIAAFQNNIPTSTVQPLAILENISKPEIKPLTTNDTLAVEVKVHSPMQHKNSNSGQEGKLPSLNTEASVPTLDSYPVLTSGPTADAKAPVKQVAPRPSSGVKTESSKSLHFAAQVSSQTISTEPTTEQPVEIISPAKPATDTVMKPSMIKADVIDSATPASLPQASISVTAPSPNRGTPPLSQQKTGLKGKDVLKYKPTAAPTETPVGEPSTKSVTSTASSTADKKPVTAETSPSSTEQKCCETSASAPLFFLCGNTVKYCF